MSSISKDFTANTQDSASFTPRAGHPFNVSLSGTFAATVGLFRQLPGDAGTVWRLVNSWTAPVETSVTEAENGASYRLSTTAWTSGAVTGRLGQSL